MKIEHDPAFVMAALRGEHGENVRLILEKMSSLNIMVEAAFCDPDPTERLAITRVLPLMLASMLVDSDTEEVIDNGDGFILIETKDGTPINIPGVDLAFEIAKRRLKSGDEPDEVIDDLSAVISFHRERWSVQFEEFVELKLRPKVGAATRLVNDPKQVDKARAFSQWQAWRAGHVVHKSGAAFARSIVATSRIESTKTVERWMKNWATEAKNRD